ncbi:hypothetical protein HYV82_00260 [Candidatus Woesearchaeota archaeon]|nr:hypothetical protein [Candidatus Woesearchaeota archaeon]
MSKRGQVTVFIILGLFVMVVAGLFLLNSQGKDKLPSRLASEQELSTVNAEGLSIQSQVNSCLKQKFLEGKSYFGLEKSAEPELKAYIESTLPQCADFTGFTSKGLKVQAGKPTATVTITEQAAVAEVQYPITVLSGQAKADMSRFGYYMKAESTILLKQGGDGKTTTDAVKQAADGLAELKIPAGTIVTKNGQTLGEVSIKVVDRNFEGLSNSVVLGEVAYEGFPDGAEFDPPIEITIRYDDADIPPGITEESLSIAYYDKKKDLWVSLLDSEVDTENNKVTARVSHFTPFAIVIGCGKQDTKENQQTIYFGYLYREPCYREGVLCPEWAGRDDGAIYDPSPNKYSERTEFKDLAESTCHLADWDKDVLTQETSGYDDVKKVGSKQSAAKFAFNLANKGDTCVQEGRAVTITVDCDDECEDFNLNGKAPDQSNIKSEGAVSKTYTLTFPASALRTGLADGEKNELSLTVVNKIAPCSGVEGTLTLQGRGEFEKCPEGEGALTKGCRCGTQNTGIIYDKAAIQNKDGETANADAFYKTVNKKSLDLTPEDKKLLSDAAEGSKARYCYKGSTPVGKEQLDRIKAESKTHKEAFKASTPKEDQQIQHIQDCCGKEGANIYPDTSSETGKEGCEIMVCKKNEQYFWTYTGKGPEGKNCKGTGGNANAFLEKACGGTGLGGAANAGVPGGTVVPAPSGPTQLADICQNKPDGTHCLDPNKNNDVYYCKAGVQVEGNDLQNTRPCETSTVCITKENGQVECRSKKANSGEMCGYVNGKVVSCEEGLKCQYRNEVDEAGMCVSASPTASGKDFAECANKKPDDFVCGTGNNKDKRIVCSGTGKGYLIGDTPCKYCRDGGCIEKPDDCVTDRGIFRRFERPQDCNNRGSSWKIKQGYSQNVDYVCCEAELQKGVLNNCQRNGKYYAEGETVCVPYVLNLPGSDDKWYKNEECRFVAHPEYNEYVFSESSTCKGACKCTITYVDDQSSGLKCTPPGSKKTETGNAQNCKEFCEKWNGFPENYVKNCVGKVTTEFDFTSPANKELYANSP